MHVSGTSVVFLKYSGRLCHTLEILWFIVSFPDLVVVIIGGYVLCVYLVPDHYMYYLVSRGLYGNCTGYQFCYFLL